MKIRTPEDVGAVIRERRLAAGLDQAELARRAGVGRQWLVEVEKGKARAEIGLILRTLNVLDASIDVATNKSVPKDVWDERQPSLGQVIAQARKPRL